MKSLSCVQLLATPWTAAHQAPPSVGFSRQEYWRGCHRLLLIEADPLTTIEKLPSNSTLTFLWLFGKVKIGKVKNLNKGVYHELIKNQKNCHFEVVISSYYMQQQIISLSDYDV